MMSKMKLITGFVAGALALLTITNSAEACVRPPVNDIYRLPVLPALVGDSPHAVVAKPVKIKRFEEYGVRYWRAVYEVLADRSTAHLKPEPIVVEWSCDRAPSGWDECGMLTSQVLPGFDEDGKTDAQYVQLDLRYRHASGFDSVTIFYAARDGSMRLPTPEQPAGPRFDPLAEGSLAVDRRG